MMLQTNYQGSWTYGFRQEDFFQAFSYMSLCKTCDPRCEVRHNLNKLGSDPLDDVYIPSIKALGQEAIFMFSLYKPIPNM